MSRTANAVPGPVASPCVNICRMDDACGWCEGCLRTIAEIAAWTTLDDAAKRTICAQLPRRRIVRRQSRTDTAGDAASP